MDAPIMTTDLAARLEAAEGAYYESRLRAIKPIERNPMGVTQQRLGTDGHVLALYAKHNPALNRVECLAAGDEIILDDVLAWYHERAAACRLVLCPLYVFQNPTPGPCGTRVRARRLQHHALWASH